MRASLVVLGYWMSEKSIFSQQDSKDDKNASEESVLWSFEDIVKQELEYHRKRDKNTKPDEMSALCLSGGGVRSAAVCLGFMRSLAKYNQLLKFNYFSTVSGGGFSGAMVNLWIKQAFSSSDKNSEKPIAPKTPEEIEAEISSVNAFSHPPLFHLRRYSNYLTPKVGFFSLDSLSSVQIFLRNMIINFLLIVPVIMAVLFVISVIRNIHLFDFSKIGFCECDIGDIVNDDKFLMILITFCVIFTFYVYSKFVRESAAVLRQYASENFQEKKKHYNAFVTLRYYNFFCNLFMASVFVIYINSFFKKNSCSKTLQQYIFGDKFSVEYFKITIENPKIYFFAMSMSIVIVMTFIVAFAAFWNAYIDNAYIDSDQDLKSKDEKVIEDNLNVSYVFPFIVEAVIRASLIAIAVLSILDLTKSGWEKLLPFLIILGPLLLTLIHWCGQIGYILVTSKRIKFDIFREWLSRYISSQLLLPLVWACLAGITYFAESLIDGNLPLPAFLKDSFGGAAAVIPPLAAILSALVALTGAGSTSNRSSGIVSSIKKVLPGIAVGLFIVLFLTSIAMLTSLLSKEYLGYSFIVIIFVAVGVAYFTNINRFTLHDIYKNRLVRCFLGAINSGTGEGRNSDPTTDFDQDDDVPLTKLELSDKDKNWPPLLLVNMTINAGEGNELAWQERQAIPFTASSISVGSSLLNFSTVHEEPSGVYRKTSQYASGMSLGEVMAISGAAFSSKMGAYSKGTLTIISMLLNVRLGVWLGNPLDETTYKLKYPRSISVLNLLYREWTGNTPIDEGYINVSDGGHFDNLGLYEMLRRRCKKIVVVDAGCDPEFKMEDLAKAIRMAKLDSKAGIEIDFEEGCLERLKNEEDESVIAEANITYGVDEKYEEVRGKLFYVKPKLYKGMRPELLSYAASNSAFPHESTTDQWFGEEQFNAYVVLGEQLGEKFVNFK